MYSTEVGVSVAREMIAIAKDEIRDVEESAFEEAAMEAGFLEAIGIDVDIEDLIDWDYIEGETEAIIEDCGAEGEDQVSSDIESTFTDYPQAYIDTAVEDGTDNFWSVYEAGVY